MYQQPKKAAANLLNSVAYSGSHLQAGLAAQREESNQTEVYIAKDKGKKREPQPKEAPGLVRL